MQLQKPKPALPLTFWKRIAENGYSKVWFNSKECYIKTESLTNFQSTPSTSEVTQLGALIGTLAVGSVWSGYGQELYTADGLEFLKKANYGHMADSEKYSASAYNIDNNNYFKLRDVTDALDCRVEWDKNSGLIRVSTSVPAYEDPSKPVG